MNAWKSIMLPLLAAGVALVLTGCGGGGGSASSNPTDNNPPVANDDQNPGTGGSTANGSDDDRAVNDSAAVAHMVEADERANVAAVLVSDANGDVPPTPPVTR